MKKRVMTYIYNYRSTTPVEKMWTMKELHIAKSENERINAFVRSFGQDASNELYVLTSDIAGPTGNSGKIFKIVPAGS